MILTIISIAEIDGILVDPFEQETGHLGETRFRVAIGRRIVAVDRAVIALAVDERIALSKILREAHHRVVDRLVAMRVKLADDLADDARGFLEARAGIEPQKTHSMQDAPVHGFEPIARIG